MDLKKICNQTIELVSDVGIFIKNERDKISHENIQIKGLHDFVTYVDKTSEQRLINGLKKILPPAGFIAEEETEITKGEIFNWVIDPLDGTTNYIHGIYPCAVSIALRENNKTILGIVYEIGLNECFYAWNGSKAYLNHKEINVSETNKVENSLIATGFPYHDYSRITPFLSSMECFMKHSRGVRRLGSAATDLAYVACGRFDAFYEYSLNAWDVAAGAFIVQQAGGKISDFRGEKNYIFGQEIVAANNVIFNEFLQLVKKYMVS